MPGTGRGPTISRPWRCAAEDARAITRWPPPGVADHVGVDRAGRQRVDPDAVAGQPRGHRLGERHHRRLVGGVHRDERRVQPGAGRHDVDDRRVVRLPQVGKRLLDEEHRALDVHVVDLSNPASVNPPTGSARAFAVLFTTMSIPPKPSVVAATRRRTSSIEPRLVGTPMASWPRAVEERDSGLAGVGLAAGDHDAGAGGGEPLGDAEADAPGPSRSRWRCVHRVRKVESGSDVGITLAP